MFWVDGPEGGHGHYATGRFRDRSTTWAREGAFLGGTRKPRKTLKTQDIYGFLGRRKKGSSRRPGNDGAQTPASTEVQGDLQGGKKTKGFAST